MDRRGAEIGQHYELFNERVIADAAIGTAAARRVAAKPLPPYAFGAIMTFEWRMFLIGEPVPTPDQVGGRLSPEHAL